MTSQNSIIYALCEESYDTLFCHSSLPKAIDCFYAQDIVRILRRTHGPENLYSASSGFRNNRHQILTMASES